MHSCIKCGNNYHITKNVENKLKGGKTNTALNLLFDKFKNNNPITENLLENIKEADLLEDSRFDALSQKDRQKLTRKITEINGTFFNSDDTPKIGSNNAYFICKYCGHSEIIPSGTCVYSKEYNVTISRDTEDYSYAADDDTLYRTNDYICRNDECKTRKDPSIKEAALLKNKIGQTIYVCTVCRSFWTVNN